MGCHGDAAFNRELGINGFPQALQLFTAVFGFLISPGQVGVVLTDRRGGGGGEHWEVGGFDWKEFRLYL